MAGENEKKWEATWSALVINENQAPLAALVNSAIPIPHSIRANLARLLHPEIDPIARHLLQLLGKKRKPNEIDEVPFSA
jgi:hypothetical protein